jgi:hypothetical protein
MANPRPAALEALQCGPSTDSDKRYFGAKSIRSLEKKTNFGPQNGDFSKMWPSSRIGLAKAVLNDHYQIKLFRHVLAFFEVLFDQEFEH